MTEEVVAPAADATTTPTPIPPLSEEDDEETAPFVFGGNTLDDAPDAEPEAPAPNSSILWGAAAAAATPATALANTRLNTYQGGNPSADLLRGLFDGNTTLFQLQPKAAFRWEIKSLYAMLFIDFKTTTYGSGISSGSTSVLNMSVAFCVLFINISRLLDSNFRQKDASTSRFSHSSTESCRDRTS